MNVSCGFKGKVNHEALSLMELRFIFILIKKYRLFWRFFQQGQLLGEKVNDSEYIFFNHNEIILKFSVLIEVNELFLNIIAYQF